MFRTFTCPSSGVLIYRLLHCRMWCYALHQVGTSSLLIYMMHGHTYIRLNTCMKLGAWGGVVAKAPRYLSDGPGIDSRWCHLIFQ